MEAEIHTNGLLHTFFVVWETVAYSTLHGNEWNCSSSLVMLACMLLWGNHYRNRVVFFLCAPSKRNYSRNYTPFASPMLNRTGTKTVLMYINMCAIYMYIMKGLNATHCTHTHGWGYFNGCNKANSRNGTSGKLAHTTTQNHICDT